MYTVSFQKLTQRNPDSNKTRKIRLVALCIRRCGFQEEAPSAGGSQPSPFEEVHPSAGGSQPSPFEEVHPSAGGSQSSGSGAPMPPSIQQGGWLGWKKVGGRWAVR